MFSEFINREIRRVLFTVFLKKRGRGDFCACNYRPVANEIAALDDENVEEPITKQDA